MNFIGELFLQPCPMPREPEDSPDYNIRRDNDSGINKTTCTEVMQHASILRTLSARTVRYYGDESELIQKVNCSVSASSQCEGNNKNFGYMKPRRKSSITSISHLHVLVFVLISQIVFSGKSFALPTDDQGPVFAAQSGAVEDQDQSNKEPCTDEESYSVGCLMGGVCTAIDLGQFGRRLECECPEGWTGERCAYRDVPHDLWFESASIMAPLIVLGVIVLLAFIIGLPLFIYHRRKHQSLTTTLQTICPCCSRACQKNKQTKTNKAPDTGKLSTDYTEDASTDLCHVDPYEKIKIVDGDTGAMTSLTSCGANDVDDDDNNGGIAAGNHGLA